MKLRYDGHGLNDADDQYARRVITWQRQHADNGGGYVLSDQERDSLGPVLAAAPELLAALEKILNAHDSGNNGACMGEAVLCQMFAELARAAIAKAKG